MPASSTAAGASRLPSGSSPAPPCSRSTSSSTSSTATTTVSTATRCGRSCAPPASEQERRTMPAEAMNGGGGAGRAGRAELLLELADDELILGWRDSEWTGIAPSLEEDVAFSSIAQNEIGHARALYELAAVELDSNADALAFDREPDEYRCAPLVELRLLDWAYAIARRYLYEEADRLRLDALRTGDDAELAGLAAKIDREEVYH